MSAFVLALLLGGSFGLASDPSGELWEETAAEQRIKGYHPLIRFSSWDITRFNRGTTYMFLTPDLIQQGQFEVRGTHYFFRAVMANELENADKDKLVAEAPPAQARDMNDAYARSMLNFEGDYDEASRTLSITYPVKGLPKTFMLHSLTEGDNDRLVSVSDEDRGLVGVWHVPDPFPNKLDARTRYKIQEQGLQAFSKEAMASDGALFVLLDMRVDGSFRSGPVEGHWSRSGSTVTLQGGDSTLRVQISADHQKLLLKGKPMFIR